MKNLMSYISFCELYKHHKRFLQNHSYVLPLAFGDARTGLLPLRPNLNRVLVLPKVVAVS